MLLINIEFISIEMKKGFLILSVMLWGIVAYGKIAKEASIRSRPMGDTVTMVVINDRFVTQVLSRDLTIPHILKAYHFINTYVKLIPSTTGAHVKDTLITFTKGKTSYAFLKTNAGNTLTSANIESNTVTTAGITVGLSKDSFQKMIAVPHISDVVIIEDKERTHRFIYTFNGNKITNIKYESPYHNY